MKKILLKLGILVAFAALMVSFVACGKPEESKKSAHYTFSLSQTEYTAYVDEVFQIPLPQVLKDGVSCEEKAVFTVRYGDQAVTLTEDGKGFVPNSAGQYTISYLMPDGLAYTPLTVVVTASVKKAQTAAPENVAVSNAGVITFEGAAGRSFLLWINDAECGEVESGDTIFEKIPEGESRICVSVTETAEALASPKSEEITVTKRAAITDLALTGSKISFTERANETYTLYLSGVSCGAVRSGDDIGGKLLTGKNDISVVTDGTQEILPSGFSNILTVDVHPQVSDFAVDMDGTVHFTERSGYTYRMTVSADDQPFEVKAGSKYFEELDERFTAAGEYTLKLEVSGDTNNVVPTGNQYSNEVAITRLQTPSGLSAEAGTLYFDEGSDENIAYTLYVDGAKADEVRSGDLLIPFYTEQEEMSVSLIATAKDGTCWASRQTSELTVSVPWQYRSFRLTGMQKNNLSTEQYTNGESIEGVGLSSAGEEKAIAAFDKTIPFSGDLVTFATNNHTSFDLSLFYVHFTDVSTNKVLSFSFFVNIDSFNAGGTYVGWKYGDTELGYGTNGGELFYFNMGDKLDAPYGTDTPRIMTMSLEGGKIKFSCSSFLWLPNLAQNPDLTGFGSEGVEVSLEIGAGATSSVLIVSAIGTTSFALPCASKTNQTHTYTNNNAETISGTKLTAVKTGQKFAFDQTLDFAGELITFGYCNNNGAYTIQFFRVFFTDVTTGQVLELNFESDPDTVNTGGVYAGWVFEGNTVSKQLLGIDISDSAFLWFGSSALPRTLTIRLNEEGKIAFNNGFPNDSWNQAFAQQPELGTFGQDGVKVTVEFAKMTAESSVIVSHLGGAALATE